MAADLTRAPTPLAGATLRAGVAGASGYAGRELVRLIAGHPRLTLGTAQARSQGYDAPDVDALAACEVAFLALPHGESRAVG
jgi:N-acetyl-gamma-glutamyl-phosphate reductase